MVVVVPLVVVWVVVVDVLVVLMWVVVVVGVVGFVVVRGSGVVVVVPGSRVVVVVRVLDVVVVDVLVVLVVVVLVGRKAVDGTVVLVVVVVGAPQVHSPPWPGGMQRPGQAASPPGADASHCSPPVLRANAPPAESRTPLPHVPPQHIASLATSLTTLSPMKWPRRMLS